ncbi:MAG: efflux RND transporter periplasmic adaptor subunit [Lachnospiraceae bacterium]|nr:efflux RND transporter periplasmic adaptor subunit [Lachnospiraceae bacterium]
MKRSISAKILRHKKACIITGSTLVLVLALGGIGYGIYRSGSDDEGVYKETTVEYGPLTVGVTEDGTVKVGTIQQKFDLDISKYAAENDWFSGWYGGFDVEEASSNKSGRTLDVEEVYVNVGQQLKKGDPLFKVSGESTETIRAELVSDEESAAVTYEKLLVEQKKTQLEAKQEYDKNVTYGKAADAEYEETVYDLQKKVDDALEDYTDAVEELCEMQEDYDRLKADYPKAQAYLEEAEAALQFDQTTYWNLKNADLRKTAKERVDSEKDAIEEYEDKIKEQNQKLTQLKSDYDDAVKELATGKASAENTKEKRIFQLNSAAEIYSIATDKIEYNAKVAREDLEDAGEKLDKFDTYIKDNIVSAEYDGVVTTVSLSKGDTVQKDTAIVILNNYDDIIVKVDVDDETVGNLKVGIPVKLQFPSAPDGNFTGTVSKIGDSTIKDNSVTYAIEIAVSGDVAGLYGGMTANVTFVTRETEAVTYVSNRAIIREGTKSYVKIKDASGKITKQEVVTGFSDGNNVEIKEGLKKGDTVLIEGKVKSA